MKLPVHDGQGKQVRQISVDDSVFGITPNMAVLHQAFVAQRANQRRGTASTKTRAEVQGSTRKTRVQKYTGRARQGGIRSPVRVGGGVAFGPRPRSYHQKLPRKMKRLAIRSALSGKLADGQLHVVDELSFARPRTKEMVRVLENVGIQRSALVVTGEPDGSVRVSARNLQKTKVLPAGYLNVVDLLTHRDLLLTEEAVRRVEGLWGSAVPEAPAAEQAKPRRRKAATAASAKVEETTEKPARRRAVTRASAEEPKPRRQRAATAASAKVEETTEKPARRRAATKASAEEPKPRRRRAATAASAEAEETPEKPARRTRRPRAKADEKVAEAAEEPKPARRRARPKKGEEA